MLLAEKEFAAISKNTPTQEENEEIAIEEGDEYAYLFFNKNLMMV